MTGNAKSKRVLMLGGTGTIGRATVARLVSEGYTVTCLSRWDAGFDPHAVDVRVVDLRNPAAVRDAILRIPQQDAIVSTLASRTGLPEDAWAVDHGIHLTVLETAREAGIEQFVLLSAICVQRPLLEFQKAKLAFEAALQSSSLTYSIVRATAFFKSLSGQVERVRAGKPFLVFGDGQLTACKPISDADLAAYLVRCLHDADLWNRVLPIGGPGPAITPLDQAAILSELIGEDVPVRRIPVAMMDAIIGVLSVLGRFSPSLAQKAELARIGRYYGTESMLVLDPETGTYSEGKTPEFGSDTLRDHYARLLRGEVAADLGDHAVF